MADLFDAVLELEQASHAEGQQQGQEDGFKQGLAEGYVTGIKTAFSLFQEIGYYRGCIQQWRVTYEPLTTGASKAILKLEAAVSSCEQMDTQADDVQGHLKRARRCFKLVQSLHWASWLAH
eukprot:m.155014 g.155014  ORF g.155014 m.155014 type:complete len:121 (+) comp16403_c0_seq8:21-383(+)